MIWPFGSREVEPRIHLGVMANHRDWLGRRIRCDLPLHEVLTHQIITGKSRSGKSRLMEHEFYELHRRGVACSFVDPHSDSALNLLKRFISENTLDPRRLWYVEFSGAEGYYPRLNKLHQPWMKVPQDVVDSVIIAIHRAFPTDAITPQMDKYLKAGIKTLVDNNLPLPALTRLLSDKEWRDGLLRQVPEQEIRAVFEHYDKMSRYEQENQIGSTLNRVFALSFHPALKYTLGQAQGFDFAKVKREGISVIWNTGSVPSDEARNLINCFIGSGYEGAAFAERERTHRRPHVLFIDEMGQAVAQSGLALDRMLNETRKFGLYLVGGQQLWKQGDDRLQASFQNCGIRASFRAGESDAEILAKHYGRIDPMAVREEPRTPNQYPLYQDMGSQRQEWVNRLVDLRNRHFFMKVGDGRTMELISPEVPDYEVDPTILEMTLRQYRTLLMEHVSQIKLPYEGSAEDTGTKRIGKR